MTQTAKEAAVKIGHTSIGQGHPTYIIAEMSANHGGDYERAVDIIGAAKEAGADAVKLQTYKAETLTLDCSVPPFYIEKGPWAGQTLHQLYQKATTPWEWYPRLQDVAEKEGITLFSAPFDETAVTFLESVNCPAYKIASYEIIEEALLEKVAETGKPLIMSTGQATLAEIDNAVRTVRRCGAEQIVLLKCTSTYPAPPDQINLKTIPHMIDCFDIPIGLSDHSMGIGASVAAVALGASMIEKHFILDRKKETPDSFFSMTPHEFKSLVQEIRTVEQALGKVDYPSLPDNSRRGLWASCDIRTGDLLSSRNIKSCRPGSGLFPCFFSVINGRKAASDISKGMPITWKDIG